MYLYRNRADIREELKKKILQKTEREISKYSIFEFSCSGFPLLKDKRVGISKSNSVKMTNVMMQPHTTSYLILGLLCQHLFLAFSFEKYCRIII